jgi:hypothetical protein
VTAFSVYYTLTCEINADLYHENLIVNSNCLCGHHNENAGHYMLHCNRFTLSRIIMLFEINKLNLIKEENVGRFLIVRSKEFHA